MPTTIGATTLAARVPPGPRGNRVLGSIGPIYRDRLRFVLDTARIYGDVAQYRVAHMRMYQVNHPEGVGRRDRRGLRAQDQGEDGVLAVASPPHGVEGATPDGRG